MSDETDVLDYFESIAKQATSAANACRAAIETSAAKLSQVESRAEVALKAVSQYNQSVAGQIVTEAKKEIAPLVVALRDERDALKRDQEDWANKLLRRQLPFLVGAFLVVLGTVAVWGYAFQHPKEVRINWYCPHSTVPDSTSTMGVRCASTPGGMDQDGWKPVPHASQ